jgi:hypothetical protein
VWARDLAAPINDRFWEKQPFPPHTYRGKFLTLKLLSRSSNAVTRHSLPPLRRRCNGLRHPSRFGGGNVHRACRLARRPRGTAHFSLYGIIGNYNRPAAFLLRPYPRQAVHLLSLRHF